jgi:hypothetical protein
VVGTSTVSLGYRLMCQVPRLIGSGCVELQEVSPASFRTVVSLASRCPESII